MCLDINYTKAQQREKERFIGNEQKNLGEFCQSIETLI